MYVYIALWLNCEVVVVRQAVSFLMYLQPKYMMMEKSVSWQLIDSICLKNIKSLYRWISASYDKQLGFTLVPILF